MSARHWSWFHLFQVALWAALIPIALGSDLKDSVPFLVTISLLALVFSELAAWQAARMERRADPEDAYGEAAA